MNDACPISLGEVQVATDMHPVGGNAVGVPIAPDPAGERGKGRGSLRRKSAPEPPPHFLFIDRIHDGSAECAVFVFSGY